MGDGMYELTGAQQQIASLATVVDPRRLVIGGTAVFVAESPVSAERVWGVLADIIENNDVFRVELVTSARGTSQRFLASPPRNLELFEFRGQEELDAWRADFGAAPLAMSGSPWALSGLVIDGGRRYGIAVQMHHVISDAYSVALVMEEFQRRMTSSELEPRPAVERGSFESSILAYQGYRSSERFTKDWKSWQDELSAQPTSTPWPDVPDGDYASARRSFPLDPELTELLVGFVREHRTRISSVVMACCARLTDVAGSQECVTIGTTVHGRHSREERTAVGMLVNTVPVFLRTSPDTSFLEAVGEADVQRTRAIRKNRFNFTTMRYLIGDDGGARPGLCDLIINEPQMQNPYGYEAEIDWRNSGQQRNALTISVTDWDASGRFGLDYDYRTAALSSEEVTRFHRRLLTVMRAALTDPSAPVHGIPRLSAEDRAALDQLNALRSVDFPRESTVLSLWEEQVRLSAADRAVIGDAGVLTYAAVDARANGIAQALLDRGVGRGDYVALLGERTPDLVCAILGIVKSGAAYVPIDPAFPAERIRYILDDCDARLVVAVGDVDPAPVSGDRAQLRLADADLPAPPRFVPPRIDPADDLYVIYTSGTTGMPKGVRVSHRNVVRLLRNDAFPFRFSADDVWLLFHYYGFDFSVWEMYGALLYGGALVVPTAPQTRDPEALDALMDATRVTVLNQVPSSFYALSGFLSPSTCARLRYVVFGGEALDESRIRAWSEANPHVDVVNMYGITETTVHVTFLLVEAGEGRRRGVGRPLPTTGIVILDGQEMLGIGEAGEICVYGEGVSHGYLNRDQLTGERFVFVPALGETVYRSGDLGILDASGSIEYLGRRDTQVKVNGFRIELGEIDAVLRSLPGVADCAVLGPADDIGGVQAYYVAEPGQSVTGIDRLLGDRLPRYMVPAHLLEVEKIPVSSNGKLDARVLRELLAAQRSSPDAVRGAETDLELLLVQIYAEVLRLEHVGVDDDFHALGGDSITSMMIVSLLRERGYHVKPQEIQSEGTIARVARVCTPLEEEASPISVEPFGPVEHTPIVHDFTRMPTGDPAHHNQALLLELAPGVATDALAAAWERVVARHPVLRARWADDRLDIPETYLAGSFALQVTSVDGDEGLAAVMTEINRPFALQEQPLIRAILVHDTGRDLLLLAAHHLVIDGVSWRILLRDLSRAVQDPEARTSRPATESPSYRAWALALSEFASRPAFATHRQYWASVHESIAALDGPGRPAAVVADAETVMLSFPRSEIERAAGYCLSSYGMDFGQALTALVCVSVAELLGSPRILAELEHHGRMDLGFGSIPSETIGWFTATYPVVLALAEDIDVSLIECKDRLSAAAKHALGDGILRMRGEAGERVPADLTVNYLGDAGDLLGADSVFAGAEPVIAGTRSPQERLRSRIVIDAIRRGDVVELHVTAGRDDSGLVARYREVLDATLARVGGEGRREGAFVTATDVGADDLAATDWLELVHAYGE